MTATHNSDAQTYCVRGRDEDVRHAHPVEARSFEEAAVAFVERWTPAVDDEGEASVIVTDERGRQCCYRLSLDGEAPRPC